MAARFHSHQTGSRKDVEPKKSEPRAKAGLIEVAYPEACRIIMQAIHKDSVQGFILKAVESVYDDAAELAKYGLEKTSDKRIVVCGSKVMVVSGFVKVIPGAKPAKAIVGGDMGRVIYAPIVTPGGGAGGFSIAQFGHFVHTCSDTVAKLLAAFPKAR